MKKNLKKIPHVLEVFVTLKNLERERDLIFPSHYIHFPKHKIYFNLIQGSSFRKNKLPRINLFTSRNILIFSSKNNIAIKYAGDFRKFNRPLCKRSLGICIFCIRNLWHFKLAMSQERDVKRTSQLLRHHY